MKTCVKELVAALYVSRIGNHVAVILASNTPRVLFAFTRSFDQGEIFDLVDGISRVANEQPNIDQSLQLARNPLFKNHRKYSRKLVLVLKAGAASSPSSWAQHTALQTAGIMSVSIGVTLNGNTASQGTQFSAGSNVFAGSMLDMATIILLIKTRYFIGECIRGRV